MKKIIGLLTFMLFATTSYGEEITKHQACREAAIAGETVVIARKTGISLHELMGMIEGQEGVEMLAPTIQFVYRNHGEFDETDWEEERLRVSNAIYSTCMDTWLK
jgi:hypothetical protein